MLLFMGLYYKKWKCTAHCPEYSLFLQDQLTQNTKYAVEHEVIRL